MPDMPADPFGDNGELEAEDECAAVGIGVLRCFANGSTMVWIVRNDDGYLITGDHPALDD